MHWVMGSHPACLGGQTHTHRCCAVAAVVTFEYPKKNSRNGNKVKTNFFPPFIIPKICFNAIIVTGMPGPPGVSMASVNVPGVSQQTINSIASSLQNLSTSAAAAAKCDRSSSRNSYRYGSSMLQLEE